MNLTPSQKRLLASAQNFRRAVEEAAPRSKPRRQWPMVLLALLAVIVIGLLLGIVLMYAFCDAPPPSNPAPVAVLGAVALGTREDDIPLRTNRTERRANARRC